MAKQSIIISTLLAACEQARAALPDAWFAVKSNVPTEVIDLLDKAIAQAEKAGFATGSSVSKLITSWEYHQHGQQKFFLLEEWQTDAANGNTFLGYQKWVEHNLESLLHDSDLEGFEAVYVASMGEVGVVDEEEALFFSVYSRKRCPGDYVEEICDFNTKDQAIEFADAVAARFGMSVYGNMCSIERTLVQDECPMKTGGAAACQHCEECYVELPEDKPSQGENLTKECDHE